VVPQDDFSCLAHFGSAAPGHRRATEAGSSGRGSGRGRRAGPPAPWGLRWCRWAPEQSTQRLAHAHAARRATKRLRPAGIWRHGDGMARVALTYAATLVVGLAAQQAGRPDLIRSPTRVLAHTWCGYRRPHFNGRLVACLTKSSVGSHGSSYTRTRATPGWCVAGAESRVPPCANGCGALRRRGWRASPRGAVAHTTAPSRKSFQEEEEWIVALRKDRKLGARRIQHELRRIYTCSRSLETIHTVLVRHPTPPVRCPKRPVVPKRSSMRLPGERAQMDTMKLAPGLYQYTCGDDCTRFLVAALYPRRTAAHTLAFRRPRS
jgi:hypothetical protein